MELLLQILNIDTNELIISFFTNNIVLCGIIYQILKYITNLTKTKKDDSLPGFFKSVVDSVKGGKKEDIFKDYDGSR